MIAPSRDPIGRWVCNWRRGAILPLLFTLLLLPVVAPCQNTSPRVVVLAKIDGPILPPTRDYYERALRRAERENAACLLVEMNTPGGLMSTMREISQLNLTAKVPVVVYITPPGARAGSAGAIIALSANLVAMAPGTNIGAAHPVTGSGKDIDGDMRDKVTNDAAAFARSLAQKRGRSISWSEGIIRKSVSSSETEARTLKVCDILAVDRADLLKQLNGRKVSIPGGFVTMSTERVTLQEESQTWGEGFLFFLFNPTVTILLYSMALYGIIAELNHPGAILPGVVGAIALVLALFSMSVLSVNATGVVLLLLSLALFGVDLYATTHGVLTVGGIAAFVAGALLLFNPGAIGADVSLPVVIGLALFTALFFGLIVKAAIRIRRQRVTNGPEALIGMVGSARIDVNPSGKVFADGAFWNAVNIGAEPIQKGDAVLIESRDGLTLKVRRVEHTPASPIWSAK